MKQLIVIALFLLGGLSTFAQHSPVLSQYMFNGLPLNPAVAGSRDALTVQLGFRRQWVGVEGAPKTESLSIHAPLKKDRLAMGLVLFNDRIGISRSTGILTSAAYRLPIRKGIMAFGLSGGMIQHRSNWSEIVTGSGSDEVYNIGDQSRFVPEFSAGVYYYSNRAYVSLSTPFMLQNVQNNVNSDNPPPQGPGPGPGPGPKPKPGTPGKMALNVMLNAGMRFAPSMDLQLTPSVMVRSYGSSFQADFNLMARYLNRFELGCSYRTQTAVVALARFRATDQVHIGYSYDLPSGAAQVLNAGGHEVTLSYDFRYKNYAQNPRFF